MQVLGPAVATFWTIASWLTSPQPALDGTPLERLRGGEVDEVVAAAPRWWLPTRHRPQPS